jgi:hypothetical protein
MFSGQTLKRDEPDINVIGLGGWQEMKFLFDAGAGILYAVPKIVGFNGKSLRTRWT